MQQDTEKQRPAALREGLDVLTLDRCRMRFFLSLILEAQLESELKWVVDDQLSTFDARVARYYGREPGDPDVFLFLPALRGIGMRHLVSGNEAEVGVDEIAGRFGLMPPAPTGPENGKTRTAIGPGPYTDQVDRTLPAQSHDSPTASKRFHRVL